MRMKFWKSEANSPTGGEKPIKRGLTRQGLERAIQYNKEESDARNHYFADLRDGKNTPFDTKQLNIAEQKVQRLGERLNALKNEYNLPNLRKQFESPDLEDSEKEGVLEQLEMSLARRKTELYTIGILLSKFDKDGHYDRTKQLPITGNLATDVASTAKYISKEFIRSFDGSSQEHTKKVNDGYEIRANYKKIVREFSPYREQLEAEEKEYKEARSNYNKKPTGEVLKIETIPEETKKFLGLE